MGDNHLSYSDKSQHAKLRYILKYDKKCSVIRILQLFIAISSCIFDGTNVCMFDGIPGLGWRIVPLDDLLELVYVYWYLHLIDAVLQVFILNILSIYQLLKRTNRPHLTFSQLYFNVMVYNVSWIYIYRCHRRNIDFLLANERTPMT